MVTDLAIAQHLGGHAVTVFSINDSDGLLSELREAGVRVVMGGKRRSFDLAVLRKLRAVTTDGAIDVVHSHNFVPNYYSAAAQFAARRKPTLLTTCHDMGTRLSNRKLRLFYRVSLARTQLVAMVSRQVFDHYIGTGMVSRARARIVMNGIPVERFDASAAQRASARHALGLADAAIVIGCVGRLVPVKNHRLLVEVMPALVAGHPGLHVVLIGKGELEQALRAQVSALGLGEHVRFAGERADVAQLLPALDIFAMPSLSEGLSIALLEACASGLAIVATDVGGNGEIVTDGSTGLLVPSGDAQALRIALGDLVADPARRASLGAAARDWVGRHASMSAFSASYDRLYREALGESVTGG
ncbi:glycosyltransferase [Dokdonella soli]|uniref:glycosyltransferase n=1 Tax=Dokdonella soli TaxID=529810 RepID=UPI0031E20A37